MKTTNIRKQIVRLIGIILFIIILLKIDVKEALGILHDSKKHYFILGLILCVLLNLIKSIRWKKILNSINIEFPIISSCLVYFAGQFWGLASPGRIGEFIKIKYLQEEEESFIDASFSVLIDRVVDVSLLFFIGIMSLLYLGKDYNRQFSFIAILVLALMIFGVLTAFIVKKGFFSVFLKIVPIKYRDKLNSLINGYKKNILKINKKDLIIIFVLTLGGWAIYFFMAYVIALVLSINLSFFDITSFVAIATSIVVLIPVSISGIGTRDISLLLLFSAKGISNELAVSFSVLILFTQIFIAFLGLTAWFIKPVKR